mgnify:CR=1 FL=1
MTSKNPIGNMKPLPPPGHFLQIYRRDLCQSAERDEPLEETLSAFAKRLEWPVEVTVREAQQYFDVGLVDLAAGMGERITATTVIEGRYTRIRQQ